MAAQMAAQVAAKLDARPGAELAVEPRAAMRPSLALSQSLCGVDVDFLQARTASGRGIRASLHFFFADRNGTPAPSVLLLTY